MSPSAYELSDSFFKEELTESGCRMYNPYVGKLYLFGIEDCRFNRLFVDEDNFNTLKRLFLAGSNFITIHVKPTKTDSIESQFVYCVEVIV